MTLNMKRERTLYVYILNILACFGVVCIHQNQVIYGYDTYTIETFYQALIFEVGFYWAVPVFFMLSGATLLSYRSRYSTKVFFIRRAKRVFIPFLFFSIVMLIWHCANGTFVIEDYSFSNLVTIILFSRHEGIYWFFLPMLATYLCIPVLSVLKDQKRILWYMFLVGFLTRSCFPLLFYALGSSWNGSADFPMTGGCLLFTILGYLLSTTNFSKTQRVGIYVLAIFSALLRYFGTIILSSEAGALDHLFFDYLQFHSVFLASGVFVFFKQVKWKRIFSTPPQVEVLKEISSCSFGIYLIHTVVQYYEKLWINWTDACLIYRTLGCFITYGVALAIIFIAKKIPLLRKLIP